MDFNCTTINCIFYAFHFIKLSKSTSYARIIYNISLYKENNFDDSRNEFDRKIRVKTTPCMNDKDSLLENKIVLHFEVRKVERENGLFKIVKNQMASFGMQQHDM